MKNGSLLLMLVLAACTPATHLSKLPSPSAIVEGKLFASVFQQRAAEYKALCFQAYNTAQLRLDLALGAKHGKPLAIITDIDETVLDNSPYEVHQNLQGKDYESASWLEWTSRGEADTVPGALSFFRYAADHGVQIFYITNRNEQERAGTLKNLQKFSFPWADAPHLVMRQNVSSKEQRRQEVMKNFEVVLLIGDNLADFAAVFDKKPSNERDAVTRQLSAEFGNRFIVLPNPVYGDWESALYEYKNWTLAQKDSVVRAAAKTY